MTPTERVRLVPHAAGIVAAVHAGNTDDVAYQLGEIATQCDDMTVWALLVTLALAVPSAITLEELKPDTNTLAHIEKAWARRSETVRSQLHREGLPVSRIVREGHRAGSRRE